ncbi:aminotransferase class V-fold PLP-dependent enzyme [Cognatilysobacter bugurensis]|uniref:Selenocysteine lyase n=1 Tax=Cognatilysobacter bugurensis TaxID=543356 RepID=A0A918T2K3_9GAMM|nr:aminotransferase class V-fold PLP-dependent enzyme [Lysobacter bugurensis]GHA87331.1 selenocysteine lyase [Lysobacter bugurensis]
MPDPSIEPLPLARARDAFMRPERGMYLDFAAHSLRLHAVHRAAQTALDAATRPWDASWDAWAAQAERVRLQAALLFDGDPNGVAFVPSAAYGLALAARALPLEADEAVLVLDDAFPSNLLPWQQRCGEAGARLVAVRRGADATAAVLEPIEHEPALRTAALEHTHWHDGGRLDLDLIANACHARGIALVLDLSQSLGAVPAEIARWRPAFAVSVGYKWLLGAHGLCVLWASPHWREHASPIEAHWSAHCAREDWSFDAAADNALRPGARRFDAGEIVDVPRLSVAEAALTQLHAWGVDAIAARLGALTARLREQVVDSFDMPDVGAPHFVGLRPRHAALDACVLALRADGIVCTARHGVLRIAPHLHIDEADIDRVASVLRAAR